MKRSESKSTGTNRKRSRNAMKKRTLKLEGLERRQLLAVITEPPTQPAPVIQEFTEARNVGLVQAFQFTESETAIESGINDLQRDADFVPLGTGPGEQDTIDLLGSLPVTTSQTNTSGFSADIDSFVVQLRGGDILDAATTGAAGGITVRDSSGLILFGSDIFIGGLQFPLQNTGNANAVVVIPEDGEYTITVSALPAVSAGNYTLGLRVYRPTSEQLAVGDTQILYLDFAGGLIDNNVFNANATIPGLPSGGVTRFRSLQESLPILGLDFRDTGAVDEIIDSVVDNVVRIFEDLSRTGRNGDFQETGNAGDFGLRVLNSRDHADQVDLNDPRLTSLLIGGTGLDFGVAGIFGIAQSVDIGNFDLSEFGIFALDAFAQSAQAAAISPAVSQVDFIGQFLGAVAAHEAGHLFGLIHTDNMNSIPSVGDAGGSAQSINALQALGNDGVFGTPDDILPLYVDDFFEPSEVPAFGFNPITAVLAHGLSSGTVGTGVSGRAFNDFNADGSSLNDAGLPGVTVVADFNGNGIADPGEATAISDSNGNFTLQIPGTVNIIATAPSGFVSTTSTTVSSGSGAIEFGFNQVIPNVTGSVFADANGNGFRDVIDGGVDDVFVYIDLDGDNRPDLGEPGTNSNPDGTYSLNFPGPGTFTIRPVVPPGFELTFPSTGEHIVNFDGVSLTGNFDFGFLPSTDFGDAPDSFGTTLQADGASHGITTGLQIGALVDRELNGQPSVAANGDDLNVDDEDGVRLLTPLAPGSTASFEVTVTNTTGAPAFLQAFIDFNGDGDFFDAGEQFATNVSVLSGTTNAAITVPISVPSNASVGTSFTRFRLSQTSGIGATGFVATGEVEDHLFPILNAAEIANNDEFTVSRNTLSNQLDVLANDFQTADNQLVIDGLNTIGTEGVVVVAADQRSVFYTPPNGFTGRDVFSYTVVDQFGNRSIASAVVNVSFQTNVPIALDDTFDVPQGSVNRALNVLDNDVASTSGGLTITSVTTGDAGGTLSIVGGGQSIRYTPLPGFDGTEQFIYSIQDSAGSTSFATVTVNLLAGSRADDIVDFTVGIFDPVNINTPISNIQVGEEFLVRVSVEHIELFANPEGVASAFIDLLYTDELVATLDTDNNPEFPFDITFGPLFSGINVLQRASSATPGLIDEVGGIQTITQQQEHTGPVELFTLRLQAVSPGVAVFSTDPADNVVSETVVLGSDVALTPSDLRLGTTELVILPSTDNFTSAIDDSFADGRDSDGAIISSSIAGRNRLDVIDNDNLGPTGVVREFGIVTAPSFGDVFIDDNNTPNNLNDDFLSYRANDNVSGLERFSYVIVTDDNVRSTAEVTIALGNLNANADVAVDFGLVAADGVTPITGVNVGEQFGVQVFVEDLRPNSTFVFAGFLDLLYDSGILTPVDTNQSDTLDFDVVFGDGYVAEAAVGTASRPGIIDEFGTLFERTTFPENNFDALNPGLLATVFFTAITPGTARIAGSPADSSPFQDTLLFGEDEPVEDSQIRYDILDINVNGTAFQNFNLPQDVNADGAVSPIDALLIINSINRISLPEGEQISGEGEQVLGQANQFLDVNGDSQITARDALEVINYIGRFQNNQINGEGELVTPLAPSNLASSNDESSDSTDAVFAGLETNSVSKIVSTELPSTTATSAIEIIQQDDSDDDDELLDLLAGDISGLN